MFILYSKLVGQECAPRVALKRFGNHCEDVFFFKHDDNLFSSKFRNTILLFAWQHIRACKPFGPKTDLLQIVQAFCIIVFIHRKGLKVCQNRTVRSIISRMSPFRMTPISWNLRL